MPDTNIFTCHLLKLNCYFTDETKQDEIFIKFNGKKIWPTDKKYIGVGLGDVDINVKLEGITPHETLTLEVWDYDLWSPNDLLGKCTMIIDKKGGPFSTDMVPIKGTDKARYTLEWQAV